MERVRPRVPDATPQVDDGRDADRVQLAREVVLAVRERVAVHAGEDERDRRPRRAERARLRGARLDVLGRRAEPVEAEHAAVGRAQLAPHEHLGLRRARLLDAAGDDVRREDELDERRQ